MYLETLWILNFVVDFLLLIATNRLSGYPTIIGRTLLAATVGGIYGIICILPGMLFLSGIVWRLIFLGVIGWIAFGTTKDIIRRCILFSLLSMAMGGIALVLGRGGFLAVVFCAVFVCFMCIFGLRGKIGNHFLPVQVRQDGKCHRFTALIDTGNMLTDPLTGQPVIVVSCDLGQRLIGEEKVQFADPVSALEHIQDGRLIPYHSVGTEGGLLAAKRYQDVTIGRWHGACLVAFSPQPLGRGEAYEALTGGSSWG